MKHGFSQNKEIKMTIKTKEDWWRAVDTFWDHLYDIISDHMDMDHIAFEEPGNSNSAITGRKICSEVVFLKENRDQRLARYFHASWGLASDSYAWSVPSWGLLCDLCSEDWVFDAPEEAPDA
jgi:hypothetical protein